MTDALEDHEGTVSLEADQTPTSALLMMLKANKDTQNSGYKREMERELQRSYLKWATTE